MYLEKESMCQFKKKITYSLKRKDVKSVKYVVRGCLSAYSSVQCNGWNDVTNTACAHKPTGVISWLHTCLLSERKNGRTDNTMNGSICEI